MNAEPPTARFQMEHQPRRPGYARRYVKKRDMEFAANLMATATSLGIASDDFRHIESQSLPALVQRCNFAFPELPLLLWWPHSNGRAEGTSSAAYASHQFMDQLGYQRIPELIPDSTEPIWMFTENWGKVERRGFDALVAFDTTPTHAHDVIDDSHGFEYMLVSQTLDWLIAENDHGYLIVSGDDVVRRLNEIVT